MNIKASILFFSIAILTSCSSSKDSENLTEIKNQSMVESIKKIVKLKEKTPEAVWECDSTLFVNPYESLFFSDDKLQPMIDSEKGIEFTTWEITDEVLGEERWGDGNSLLTIIIRGEESYAYFVIGIPKDLSKYTTPYESLYYLPTTNPFDINSVQWIDEKMFIKGNVPIGGHEKLKSMEVNGIPLDGLVQTVEELMKLNFSLFLKQHIFKKSTDELSTELPYAFNSIRIFNDNFDNSNISYEWSSYEDQVFCVVSNTVGKEKRYIVFGFEPVDDRYDLFYFRVNSEAPKEYQGATRGVRKVN